jgi:CRISPR-associated protein (TIGR02584 family)
MPDRKNILLAVSGATPAVLTETVWAMAVRDQVKLDELHVVTTDLGKRMFAEAGFFDPKRSPFTAMEQDWKLRRMRRPLPAFPEANVHIPAGMKSKDLTDSQENECMESEITDQLRRYTGDPSVRLYASLAGGRKTMAAYMILGMTAFAREDDKLHHVLMAAPGGTNPPGWWYPRPGKPKEIKWVNLFEVPFPRLRKTFETMHGDLMRTSLTAAFSKFNSRIRLDINLNDRARFIEVDGQAVKLEPKSALWLALLAYRKKSGMCPAGARSCEACREKNCKVTNLARKTKEDDIQMNLRDRDVEFCRAAYMKVRGDLEEKLTPEEVLSAKWWGSARTHMRDKLIKALGPSKAAALVSGFGKGSGAAPVEAILGTDRADLFIHGWPEIQG